MNSNPLFLHQILIPSLPNFQAGGGQFYRLHFFLNGNFQCESGNSQCFTMLGGGQQSLCLQILTLFIIPKLISVFAGFYPFLKIYQSLQLVYTSGV